MKSDDNEIKEWWNEASEYYQTELNDTKPETVRYGPFGSTERKLKLIGRVKGKRVLEVGCGGGQCSIALAKAGAECTGIDISDKQLEYARSLAKKNDVRVEFIRSSFADISKLKLKKYDVVISVFALQYAKDLIKLFIRLYSLLKDKGLLVFSLDHPFYLTMSSTDLRMSDSYYRIGKFKETEKWPDGSKHTFIMYKRKVSDIYNDLVKAGFYVETIIEPLDLDDKFWGPGYRRKLVRLIGPTIIFKARKVANRPQ